MLPAPADVIAFSNDRAAVDLSASHRAGHWALSLTMSDARVPRNIEFADDPPLFEELTHAGGFDSKP